MKSEDQIHARLARLRELKETKVQALRDDLGEEDWHGVEDGGSDIRDLEAEREALEWVLE